LSRPAFTSFFPPPSLFLLSSFCPHPLAFFLFSLHDGGTSSLSPDKIGVILPSFQDPSFFLLKYHQAVLSSFPFSLVAPPRFWFNRDFLHVGILSPPRGLAAPFTFPLRFELLFSRPVCFAHLHFFSCQESIGHPRKGVFIPS